MKMLEKRGWPSLVAVALLALVPQVRAERFGTDEGTGVEITQVPFSQVTNASQGSIITPLVIENRDAKRPAAVEIRTRREGIGLRVSRSILVPPGARVNVPWMLPIDFIKGDYYGYGGLSGTFEVTVNGRTYDNPLVINVSGSRRYGYGGTRPPAIILCSRGASRDHLKAQMQDPVAAAAAAASSRSYSASGMAESEFLQSEAEPENWPAYWMAYSAFDLVVLTKAELERLPDAVRNQLTAYAEAGGWVMVLGGDKVPKGWETVSPIQANEVAEIGVKTVPVGFGCWSLVPPLSQGKVTSPTRFGRWLSGRLARNTRAACFASNSAWDGNSFRVIEKVRIPVVGIMICIFVFSMLAGPVNILVLDRLKRRVWLLWTTPALALVFSGILIAYFLFSEGLARHALYQEVSILNEPAQRVSVLGMNAYYCPLPPDGLQYSPDTEVRALDKHDRFSGRLDMTSGTRLYSEWISPRIPANFSIRTSRTAQERIQFSRRDDKLVAMNGLGKPIRRLVVRDGQSRLWKAEMILPGAKAELVAMGDQSISQSGTLNMFFLEGNWRRDLGGANTPSRPLPSWEWLNTPGRYVAEMDNSTVFLEQGTAASDTKIRNVLILGVSADHEILGAANGKMKMENGK